MICITGIKDLKQNAIVGHQVYSHKANAVRAVSASANDPQSQLNHYPNDFELWLLGEIDAFTGEIHPKLELIASIFSLKEASNDKA